MKSTIASVQYKFSAADLEVILALVRGGTLAGAGARLGQDASTVFRALQRIERGLGQALFERTRQGYLGTELALSLAEQAEQVEAALESARAMTAVTPDQVSGLVRITTTDTVLHGLLSPALRSLRPCHPFLSYELHTGNELANLTRRDADLAVRATRRPPPHLVGKLLGPIKVALYAAKSGPIKRLNQVDDPHVDWVAPDDALPDHPSVVWRKRHHPKVVPVYRVNSVASVMDLVALGMGVGVLPLFLAQQRRDLRQLSEPLDEAQTDLWLLAHPESRHLRRVSTVYGHLARTLVLP